MIEACYRLSVPEMRLILSCVAQIDFEQHIKPIKPNQPFYISAVEYAEIFGVRMNNVYAEIEKAVGDLWDAELTIERENEPLLHTRWIQSKAEYGNGGAEILFADAVLPYLTELHEKGNFTIYRLDSVGALKSIYALRLYELLAQYKKIARREIQLRKLKEIFCLGDKYPDMCNFKRRVLDAAITEINTKTDLTVSYENVKQGRAVVSLDFTIKSKNFTIKSKKNSLTKKTGKKYLSEIEVKQMARTGETWKALYDRLEKDGYTFDRRQ